jgi:hypothetical protein
MKVQSLHMPIEIVLRVTGYIAGCTLENPAPIVAELMCTPAVPPLIIHVVLYKAADMDSLRQKVENIRLRSRTSI